MKKLTYMLEAIAAQHFVYKAWVLHCFSLTEIPETETVPRRLRRGEKHYYFLDGEEEVVLEDTDVKKAPFHFREVIALKAGDVVNLKQDTNSTYGRLLANAVALIYPLGDKIEYVEGEFNIKAVEKEIERRLTTDVEYQTAQSFKPDNPIYVSEYLNFIDAILSMEGYSQLCVPSATPKSMTRDPRIPQLRKELLEKYKDRLNDPAVIAQIEAELIQVDKEYIAGDLSEGFYRKDKSFNTVRKKMHSMYGYEEGFGLEPATITDSLTEGWDIANLPPMVNSLREGSYGRGKMTALGGYATKTMNRMLQNTSVVNTDCGTQLGWDREVTDKHVGFYYFDNQKNTVLITHDNIASLKGTVVSMRTPQFCKTRGVRFCRYCVGEPNGESEQALSAYAAAMTSQLMDIMMQSAHAKALKTAVYDPKLAIK